MNAKIYVFVICVKAIKYLLLYNFHDCTFKTQKARKQGSHCPPKKYFLFWKQLYFIAKNVPLFRIYFVQFFSLDIWIYSEEPLEVTARFNWS